MVRPNPKNAGLDLIVSTTRSGAREHMRARGAALAMACPRHVASAHRGGSRWEEEERRGWGGWWASPMARLRGFLILVCFLFFLYLVSLILYFCILCNLLLY